jgi:hypothetical protein
LCASRAQLAGDIESAHEALRKLIADLETLDATLLMLDPDYKVESIKPRALRGQMTRICLSILRQACEPLTSRDIAVHS